MKTSKFFFSTLIAAAAMTATAYAELTTVATMSDLVSVGEFGNSVSLDTDYTAESNVYVFGGEGAILNIENSSILDYINGGTGYLTIAAWINPEATSGVQSIFGYGAQQDGFKMATDGSALTFTAKGVADKDKLGTLTAGEWNLVALTINLSGESGSKYLIGDSDFWTRDLGTWNTPAEASQSFAIGSGNSESNRELFTGSIANLTVAYSETAATNAEVVALLGSAPVVSTDGKLVWAGTAEANTWNATAINWLDGESSVVFTSGSDVAFTDVATSKTVVFESGVTVAAGDVLVRDSDYVFSANSDGTATLSGTTLTIVDGASLSVGDKGNNTGKRVVIDFDSISVSGTLNFNTIGANTWSSVTLKSGGKLHIEDGHPSSTAPINLTIEELNVDGSSDIDFTYDKHLKVNSLAGKGGLTVTGGSHSTWGHARVTIEALQDYSGNLTVNSGNGGLTLNLGVAGKTTTSTANVAVNSGILNILGTTTLGVLDLGTTTVSCSGDVTVGTLKFGRGNGANTTTISGTLAVTGSVVQTSTGPADDEVLALAENATLTIGGTLGTARENADDGSQVSYKLNIGNGASLSAKTIAQANDLDVTLGANATMSAEALTLNAVWGNKTHTFVGTSSETSIVSVKGISLTNKNSNLSVSTTKVLVGSDGISGVGSVTFANTILGVQDSATSWSSSVATTLNETNTVSVESGKSVSFEGALSGTGALTKIEEGTLTLSGANSYSGGTTISAGTVVAAHEKALGTGAVTLDGGDLDIRANVTLNELNGTGAKALESDIVNKGKDEYTLCVRKGDTDGGIVGFTEHDDGSTSYTLSLVKEGGDKLSLRNYLAVKNLTIEGGTLSWSQKDFEGMDNWGSIEKDLLVKSEAQFELVLSDSSKKGYALSVGGDVNLASNAEIVVDLSGVKAGGEEIVLNIIAANAINFGWTETSEALIAADGYSVEDFVSITGDEHLAAYVNQMWSYSNGTLSLTLAIPEPSMFGLLAGLGALALAGTRRRRK